MSTGRASGPSRLRRQQRLTARQRKPNGLPHLTLAPLPGYARARPPDCLPDQVGRAAASRAGSGRLPPGGPSGKPPASPWTGHRIDRLLTQAVTSAETSTAVVARAITSSTPSIASWTVAIASGIVLLSLATALHSAEYRDPSLECSAGRSGGSATSTGSTRAAARLGYHRLGHERLRPPTATRCSRGTTCAS
jgi:hypothetical protein